MFTQDAMHEGSIKLHEWIETELCSGPQWVNISLFFVLFQLQYHNIIGFRGNYN